MDFFLDLRQSARAVARDRAFTTIAVVLLAMGIAANATIFSVMDAVLLQPLPFTEPDALVHVAEVTPRRDDFVASQPNYIDFRTQQSTLIDLAAFRSTTIIYTDDVAPRRVEAAAVSASFFDVLGVDPIAGRTFTEAEDAPGAPAAVAVISEHFWRERLNSAQNAVGTTITLNGAPHTITGIMPRSFTLPAADVWVPLGATTAADRTDHWLDLVGRLRSGIDARAAQADLAAISARIGAEHPEVSGWSVRVRPLDHVLIGEAVGRAMWMLMAAVGLLLLLACANVANLFTARATSRRGELAVRTALGAGRGRIVRQLLTEAALVSAAGATVALVLCTWGLYAVRALADDRIRGLATVQLDGRAVAFTILISVVVTLVFGLMPAWRAGRVDLQRVLKHGVRGSSERESRRTRELLVVAQVAMAIVLLIGAGLLMRSYLELRAAEPGFTTQDVYAVPLELTGSTYEEYWQVAAFYRELPERLVRIPGVVAAGASITQPFSGWRLTNDVTPVERAAEVGASGLLQADWRSVTPGYFDAVQVPLLQGRIFAASDTDGSPGVTVITRSLAERLWPGRSAVGRHLFWGGVNGDPIEVIGVVGDVQDAEVAAPAPPLMFLSAQQVSVPNMTVLVRTRGAVSELAEAIRSAIWSLNPAVPVPQIQRVDTYRHAAMSTPRTYAALLATFALLALFVATLGVYALVSYQVASRARELGIRHALGAHPRALHVLLLRRTGMLIVAGAVAGIALMLVLGRFIGSLLYETAETDPLTFAALPLLFVVVALAAAYVPMRRATTVDPLTVLRSQ